MVKAKKTDDKDDKDKPKKFYEYLSNLGKLNRFLASFEENTAIKTLIWTRIKVALLYTTLNCYNVKLTKRDITEIIENQKTYGCRLLDNYIIARNLNGIYEEILRYKYSKNFEFEENTIKDILIDLIRGTGADPSATETISIYKGSSDYNKLQSTLLNSLANINKHYEQPKNENNLYEIFDLFFLMSKSTDNTILVLAIVVLNLSLFYCGHYPIILSIRANERYLKKIKNYNLEDEKQKIQAYDFMLELMITSLSKIDKIAHEANESGKPKIHLADLKKQGFLTTGEFAKKAGCQKVTIQYWVKEGKIKPAIVTSSGYKMFKEEQLKDLPNRGSSQAITFS